MHWLSTERGPFYKSVVHSVKTSVDTFEAESNTQATALSPSQTLDQSDIANSHRSKPVQAHEGSGRAACSKSLAGREEWNNSHGSLLEMVLASRR